MSKRISPIIDDSKRDLSLNEKDEKRKNMKNEETRPKTSIFNNNTDTTIEKKDDLKKDLSLNDNVSKTTIRNRKSILFQTKLDKNVKTPIIPGKNTELRDVVSLNISENENNKNNSIEKETDNLKKDNLLNKTDFFKNKIKDRIFDIESLE